MVILESFVLVFLTEMGDKSQLLAFMLAVKFKRPWLIMSGILTASLINNTLAAFLGAWVQAQLGPEVLDWILTGVFVAFGIWILIPGHEEKPVLATRKSSAAQIFWLTVTTFCLAEMGDKTQLSTLALAAKFDNVLWVTLGTSFGMVAADGLAVFFGKNLTQKIPMKWIRIFSALLFFAMAVLIWIP